MSNEFIRKYGDTEPDLLAVLHDQYGTPVWLGATTILLHIRRPSPDAALVLEAEVANEAEGLIRYVWADPLILAVGLYEAEWQVTWSDGTVQTFPNDGYFLIKVVAQIA